MENKRQLTMRNTINLLCLIIMVAGLVGCGSVTEVPPIPPDTPSLPPTNTSTNTAASTTTPTPTSTAPAISNVSLCRPGPKLNDLQAPVQATNGFFIDNQVIITGLIGDIRETLNTVANQLGLNPEEMPNFIVEECDLSFLGASVPPPDEREGIPLEFPPGKESTDWPFKALAPPGQYPLVMQLYEFPEIDVSTVEPILPEECALNGDIPLPNPDKPVLPVEYIVCLINQAGNPSFVFADPNYLTNSTALEPSGCGQPHSPGGSGGGPYGEPGIAALTETPLIPPIEEQFLGQWALGQGGINLPSVSPYAGTGVRVGIFDTSPFGIRTQMTITPPPTLIPVATFEVPVPTLHAQHTHLELHLVDALSFPPLGHRTDRGDISDHGLFEAALIHTIAPAAEIHLIRVLNDEGCGRIFELNKAVQNFNQEMSSHSGGERYFDRVVMNFSITVRKRSQQQPPGPDESVNWAVLQEQIASLRGAIGSAYQMGAVIVAASGNDSFLTATDPNGSPESMRLPAGYDRALGVAANNMVGDRACFSNVGDLAAPGGEGGTATAGPCQPRADTWDRTPDPCTGDLANCQYGLISIGILSTGGEQGYIYWSGTSFSTPLVAGLAALALERTNGSRRKSICLIQEGASTSTPTPAATPLTTPTPPPLGRGRIDIAQSLSDMIAPICNLNLTATPTP